MSDIFNGISGEKNLKKKIMAKRIWVLDKFLIVIWSDAEKWMQKSMSKRTTSAV